MSITARCTCCTTRSTIRCSAGLRMNILANPGVEKVDFELWSLAVSAVNGLRPVPRQPMKRCCVLARPVHQCPGAGGAAYRRRGQRHLRRYPGRKGGGVCLDLPTNRSMPRRTPTSRPLSGSPSVSGLKFSTSSWTFATWGSVNCFFSCAAVAGVVPDRQAWWRSSSTCRLRSGSSAHRCRSGTAGRDYRRC